MMLRNRKVVVKGSKANIKNVEKRRKVSFRTEGRTKVNEKLSDLAFNCSTGVGKSLTQCDCVPSLFQSSNSEDSTNSEQNNLPYQVAEYCFSASASDDTSSSQMSEFGQSINILHPSSILEETVKSDTKEDLCDADAEPLEVIPIDVVDSNDTELETEKQNPSSNSGQDANSSDIIVLLDSPVSVSSGNRTSQSMVVTDSPVSEKSISQSTTLLDSTLSADLNKRAIQCTSVNVPMRPSHNRKRKHSEDSGVEILYTVAGGKRKKQCRSPSETIVEKNLRLNVSKKQNFSISVTDNVREILPKCQKETNRDIIHISSEKGNSVGDDVIFVGGNDDEVSVIDTRKEQGHKSVNIYSVNNEKNYKNETEVDDIIILDSPCSKTPVQSLEKKSKRMLSVSTSVTGLIPHYTRDLLDFIPIGGKPATATPKMPIRRRAKVRERRRRRWAEADLNRPRNIGFEDQNREQVVQKHLTSTQNSGIAPSLECVPASHSDPASSSSLPSSSLNEKEQTTSAPQSSTSTGTNICNPNASEKQKCGLRPVIIDGNNIAMGHGKGKIFSWRGLHICIEYFLKRGHKVTAFVPTFRKGVCPPDLRSEMDQYEKNGELVFTPSRRVDGRLIVSYDDRFIVQCAAELGGVIVSTDNYRDLLNENSSWKETIERRLLMFTWVGDLLMFPNDPLGRNGPSLEEFLQFPANECK